MILDDILFGKKLVFDIGSNIGSKAELFLTYGVKVVCVEPQEDCLSVLHARFKGKNVEIVPHAVSSDGTNRKFRISNANTLSTFSDTFIGRTEKDRFKNYSWGNPMDIKTITLDILIKRFGLPDFCKIDVEGSEIEVLSGLSTTIPYISFEYTPELHDIAISCLDILISLGDYRFKYSEGETLTSSLNNWVGKEEIVRYLIDNRGGIVFGDIYAKIGATDA